MIRDSMSIDHAGQGAEGIFEYRKQHQLKKICILFVLVP